MHSFPLPLGADDGGAGAWNKPPPIHLSPPAFQRRPKAPHWILGLLGAVVKNRRPTQAQCQTLFVWRCACTGPPLPERLAENCDRCLWQPALEKKKASAKGAKKSS